MSPGSQTLPEWVSGIPRADHKRENHPAYRGLDKASSAEAKSVGGTGACPCSNGIVPPGAHRSSRALPGPLHPPRRPRAKARRRTCRQ